MIGYIHNGDCGILNIGNFILLQEIQYLMKGKTKIKNIEIKNV